MRKASAPDSSTSVIGSIALPSDFDIFCPLESNTSGAMNTVGNGSFPKTCSPIITILETHNGIISPPVMSTCEGYHALSAGVCSGQPRMEKGHNPLENQVSSVSGSRRK